MKRITLMMVIITLMMVTLVSATMFDDVVLSHQNRLGGDNVTILNDYQFVYYYNTYALFDNFSIEPVYNETLNVTTNMSVNRPYTEYYYRASIMDVVGYSFYSEIISEVMYDITYHPLEYYEVEE
jgi:hypothetical protein